MSGWYLTLKDLVVLTRDKQALVLLLVLPLLLISIIGISTGQFLAGGENIEQAKIVVVDHNNSDTSHNLIAEMKQRPELKITSSPSVDVARGRLRRGDAMLVLVIGPKFEELVDDIRLRDIVNFTDESPANGLASLDLSVSRTPSTGVVGELLEGVVYSLAIKFVAPIAAAKNPVARRWLRSEDNDAATNGDQKAETPAAQSKPKGNMVSQWVVPGFTVMFAFFLINIMARSFMIEREQGTLRRLLMAPLGTLPLLLGKTIPFYLTSILQCSLLFLCGRLLFGMPWGPQPVYLIPVILCTSASAAALGLLLSTMVRTDQQIASYGTTLILLLSALSGCFLPRELSPRVMKQISLFTPHAWSLAAFDNVLNQPSVDIPLIANCCGVLVAFSMVCFTTGWWRFQNASRG